MRTKTVHLVLVLALVSSIMAAIPFTASNTNRVAAETTTLEYIITGQFVAHTGEVWSITQGSMSWQLFEVRPYGEQEWAVYSISEFSIDVIDPWGVPHTIKVVPDGLRCPGTCIPVIPDIVQDSGIVSVYSGGFIDMYICDLSVDGQPVDQTAQIGGPAFVGSSWAGMFPNVTSFVNESLVDLTSLGLYGEYSITGELVHTPVPAVPTVNQYGIVAMMSLFTGLLVWMVQRKQPTS